ncbi:MAG: SCO family protein [Micropepsaceae bacterium]
MRVSSVIICLGLLAAFALAARTTSVALAKPVAASTSSFAKLGQGIGAVTLVDTAGKGVQWDQFKGKPRVLFFGFTHCPVVCPVTVWELDAALAEIGAPADTIKITFVTLDPKRDTSAVLAKYFSGFKGRVVPLTGSEKDTARLARAYDIHFERVDTGKGDYTLDHTAIAFLINAEGHVVDTLAFGASRELSVTRLKALLAHPN